MLDQMSGASTSVRADSGGFDSLSPAAHHFSYKMAKIPEMVLKVSWASYSYASRRVGERRCDSELWPATASDAVVWNNSWLGLYLDHVWIPHLSCKHQGTHFIFLTRLVHIHPSCN